MSYYTDATVEEQLITKDGKPIFSSKNIRAGVKLPASLANDPYFKNVIAEKAAQGPGIRKEISMLIEAISSTNDENIIKFLKGEVCHYLEKDYPKADVDERMAKMEELLKMFVLQKSQINTKLYIDSK